MSFIQIQILIFFQIGMLVAITRDFVLKKIKNK